MTTRIGLLSDVHASPEPVREALAIFRERRVSDILCAGDIAGYGDELAATVALLADGHCQSILGNHEIWYLEDEAAHNTDAVYRYFAGLPFMCTKIIEGKRLYMVHASPPRSHLDGIRLLDEHGDILPEERSLWDRQLADFDYDVLIVGHTHQVFAERLAGTLVINPGSTLMNHSCAILTLPDMQVEVFGLSGKPVVRAWNWGMLVAGSKAADH